MLGQMSEVFMNLTEDFAKLTEDFSKLTEVLSQMTERIFQMSKAPQSLTEHHHANVRTPTKIGNKMSETMGKLSEWFLTSQKWFVFLSFYTKINEKPKVQKSIC